MRRFLSIFILALLCFALAPAKILADTAQIEKILANAALQTTQTHYYDPAYVRLPFPGGDIPIDRGVCTDVIIRAFRAAEVDLQVLLHQDMKQNFAAYPKQWGLTRPDANIDHRRVPNLMKFYERKGKSLPVSSKPEDYLPGDVVAWRLPNGLYHIGIVTSIPAPGSKHYMVVHNIGQGTRTEDILFSYEILGRYRYF